MQVWVLFVQQDYSDIPLPPCDVFKITPPKIQMLFFFFWCPVFQIETTVNLCWRCNFNIIFPPHPPSRLSQQSKQTLGALMRKISIRLHVTRSLDKWHCLFHRMKRHTILQPDHLRNFTPRRGWWLKSKWPDTSSVGCQSESIIKLGSFLYNMIHCIIHMMWKKWFQSKLVN